MNLFSQLQSRHDSGRPIRVALIGAGKFGSMFLSQIRLTPGIHLLGIADLSIDRVSRALLETGWVQEDIQVKSISQALVTKKTFITDDSITLIQGAGLDIVIEATGIPEAGVRHALAAIDNGRHIIMVNVEADVLCGPLLARRAKAAGLVYSMAYGDQPSLISEQVDWARACGFEVVSAGKGTLYMPEFHSSTPDTVWDHYGLTKARARKSGMKAKMFNSFLDGTKSGIEMAAVSNSCDLMPGPNGLSFPVCEVEQLASKIIPWEDGGCLDHSGQVEVVSSRSRGGIDVESNLRWGTYVTFRAPSDYVKGCFSDYGLITDESGTYSALWRPYHLIGLELGISVAYVGLFGQATGCPTSFRADVVATAKRGLNVGEILDGEGGFMVWGRLMDAAHSLHLGAVPIGLAHQIQIKRNVKEGDIILWDDVQVSGQFQRTIGYVIRREMELVMGPKKEKSH